MIAAGGKRLPRTLLLLALSFLALSIFARVQTAQAQSDPTQVAQQSKPANKKAPRRGDLFSRVDINQDNIVQQQEFSATRARDFGRLDSNRDNRISRTEFVGRASRIPALARLRAGRFRTMDRNGDNYVSRPEYLAFGNDLFRRFDQNKDGKITRGEYRATLNRRPPPLSSASDPSKVPPPPGPKDSAPTNGTAGNRAARARFASLDQNGDGFVTGIELDKGRAAAFRQLDSNRDNRLSLAEAIARRGPTATARMAQLDRNKDGVVSLAEFTAAGRILLRRADRNRDGRLTFAEFQGVR